MTQEAGGKVGVKQVLTEVRSCMDVSEATLGRRDNVRYHALGGCRYA